MRNLREELKLRFEEFSGEEYGMTVCIMLGKLGPIWIDIVMMMDSAGKIFYVPVYTKTEQLIRSSKIGEFYAPLTSRIDIDDVFDGSRTCLLDFISHAGEMGTDDALYVMYVAKKETNSTSDGWECEYYPKRKVVLLEEHKSTSNAEIPYRPSKCPLSQKRMRVGEFDRVFDHNQIEVDEDDSIFDMDDSDFPGDKSDTWDVGNI